MRHPDQPEPLPRFPGGVPDGALGPDLDFYRIADRYLDDSMRAYPTIATMVGYHAYDALLEDLSEDGIKFKLELAKRYRSEIAAVDPKHLSTSARIDYHLGRNDRSADLAAVISSHTGVWDSPARCGGLRQHPLRRSWGTDTIRRWRPRSL